MSLFLVPCLHDLYQQDHLALVWMQHLNLTCLAAAKCHRCSRRISGSIAAAMCLRFLGRYNRFAAVGGSDAVLNLRWFGEWLEEDPGGRFCMLNRRNYTRNGHDWNPKPDMELESLRGGEFVFLEGGFAKRGVRTNPPNPLWLRA